MVLLLGLAGGVLLILDPGISGYVIAGVVILNVLVIFTFESRRSHDRQRIGDLKAGWFVLLTLRDLLGGAVLLVIASFAGNTVGVFASMRAGPWVGLVTGLAAGFASAWLIMRIWRRFFGKP
jgi:hypothetical protein